MTRNSILQDSAAIWPRAMLQELLQDEPSWFCFDACHTVCEDVGQSLGYCCAPLFPSESLKRCSIESASTSCWAVERYSSVVKVFMYFLKKKKKSRGKIPCFRYHSGRSFDLLHSMLKLLPWALHTVPPSALPLLLRPGQGP